ncbi:MAG TPA: methyltransferase domain-containing protein [Bryobacteraceae bacterium]|nr:methyltransferase domain-containing protein [Bryobacteraceae bacterium]
MHCLGGRVILPEILDTLPEDEARASLADLTRINARWGGHSTLRKLLGETVQPDETFSMLDVGAASGDMGACVRQWYPNARVVSLDRIATHLAKAQGDRIVADAFHLPIRDDAFDFVFCSLFLHHFTDEQVVDLLRDFGRVARRAVLAIDLERHPVAYYFLPWTRWIFGWDRVTVHDGAISVEAAFQPRELETLATRAGLHEARARAYRPAFRIAMMATMTAKCLSYNSLGG